MSFQDDVVAQLAPWTDLLGRVVQNNPSGDIYDMIARPDLARRLEEGLTRAQELAETAFAEAWPDDLSPWSPYRASLAADLDRAYATASATLRQVAIESFRLGPQEMLRRVASAVWQLAFRNEMTVAVAETRHHGEEVLARAEHAGIAWEKKWVCKKAPGGKPDSKVCGWCRLLDAMPAIPVGTEFPPLAPIGNRRPPRPYRDLMCPPAHPRCRCKLILVHPGISDVTGAPLSPAEVSLFVTAQSVRDMTVGKYNALTDFHRAALHELGQVLRYHQAGRK
jgi:hypothetical protein